MDVVTPRRLCFPHPCSLAASRSLTLWRHWVSVLVSDAGRLHVELIITVIAARAAFTFLLFHCLFIREILLGLLRGSIVCRLREEGRRDGLDEEENAHEQEKLIRPVSRARRSSLLLLLLLLLLHVISSRFVLGRLFSSCLTVRLGGGLVSSDLRLRLAIVC